MPAILLLVVSGWVGLGSVGSILLDLRWVGLRRVTENGPTDNSDVWPQRRGLWSRGVLSGGDLVGHRCVPAETSGRARRRRSGGRDCRRRAMIRCTGVVWLSSSSSSSSSSSVSSSQYYFRTRIISYHIIIS